VRQFFIKAGEQLVTDVKSGTLYLVATPIGNLSDISARALKTLEDVDFIAAEDTRVTRKLLEHYKIKKELVSYFQHNIRTSGEKILARIIDGKNCALVTDAGVPGVSDPGEALVRSCADLGIKINIIPGPSAVVSALAVSGLATERFTFEGFLSVDKKKRTEHLNELKNEKRTMVLYEAPHRLKRSLRDLYKTFGDRHVSISREMTKIYEETLRLTLSEAIDHFDHKPPKGEFVLVIEGISNTADPEDKLEEAIEIATALVTKGMSSRDAVKKAADDTGCSRNALYKIMLNKPK